MGEGLGEEPNHAKAWSSIATTGFASFEHNNNATTVGSVRNFVFDLLFLREKKHPRSHRTSIAESWVLSNRFPTQWNLRGGR